MGFDTLIHERVALAQRGENLTVIGRMRSGWAVLGDRQFIPGYCLLLPDPVVGSLNELHVGRRNDFLQDMALLGDALLGISDATRINYSILGNAEPALHAHVFPRYATEPKDYVSRPVWCYPRADRESAPFDEELDSPLITSVYVTLLGLGAVGQPGPLVRASEDASAQRLELSRHAASPRRSAP